MANKEWYSGNVQVVNPDGILDGVVPDLQLRSGIYPIKTSGWKGNKVYVINGGGFYRDQIREYFKQGIIKPIR